MDAVNPAVGRISSAFNPARKHPVTGKVQPHEGTDVANVTGTPVYAAHGGIVRASMTGPASGGSLQWIAVTDGSLETRYLHLSRRDVHAGQKVRAGDRIGLMGATGVVSGPHLHFEVRRGGVAIDPVPWLAARGVTLGSNVPTPIPLPVNLPEDKMRRITKIRSKDVPLAKGSWKTLPINDKGHTSVTNLVGRGTLTANFTFTGVPKGREVQVRAIIVETDSKGKGAKIVQRIPLVEIIGTGGKTFGQLVAPYELAKIAGTRQRRLRIQAVGFDDGIKVTQVRAVADVIPA